MTKSLISFNGIWSGGATSFHITNIGYVVLKFI